MFSPFSEINFGHQLSVNIVIFIVEFALKMVLEECCMAKSYLNLAFHFGAYFC